MADLREAFRKSPECQLLADGWTAEADSGTGRIFFIKKGDISGASSTWDHPSLGPLPRAWILKAVRSRSTGRWRIVYFNINTNHESLKDPRLLEETLSENAKRVPLALAHAAATQKSINASIDPSKMSRAPIGNKNIRHYYEIMKTLDPGDGTKGGMNGGVFVVRMIAIPSKLYIEKRFKAEQVKTVTAEIRMIRRLNHSSLTSYSAAFIIDTPYLKMASLYIEFCDRGDLDGVIKRYFERRKDDASLFPPEAFIWHAFGGLLDGLCYLQTGTGHIGNRNIDPPKGWTPILHRDMKPDNVLLRSRSTVGSKKYFYCVLSDFGLACEPNDPSQKHGIICGTTIYWPPELCWKPVPQNSNERKYFPGKARHSAVTDVWALGATIHNLANCQGGMKGIAGHLNMTKPDNVSWDDYLTGHESRKRAYPWKIARHYSSQLNKLVQLAMKWDDERRPDPVKLMKEFQRLAKEAGFVTQGNHPPLHEWATKQHTYFIKE